jgi:hypothetical protein
MANSYVSTDLVAEMTALAIRDQAVVANLGNRNVEEKFSPGVGKTVNIVVPPEANPRSFVADGDQTVVEDVSETTVPITLEDTITVTREVTKDDLRDIETVATRVVQPMSSAIVAGVEKFLIRKLIYGSRAYQAGTQGTDPSTHAHIIAAEKAVFEQRRRAEDLISVINADTWANFRELTIFNSLDFRPEGPQSLKKAGLGQTENISFFRTPFGGDVEYGNTTGTILVDGASQTGTSLVVDGFTYNSAENVGSTTVQAGQVYQGTQCTIAGVSGTYRLAADAKVVGNTTTFVFETALASSPADDAAITFLAADSARQRTNIVYDPQAFGIALLPIKNDDQNVTSASVDNIGISIVSEGTNRTTLKNSWSFVVEVGASQFQPKFSTLY